MTGKRAIHKKIRALAGSALVGPGLFVLFGHLVCAAAQLTDLLRSTSGLGVLSSIILAASSDRHWLLQSYVWQQYDLFPKFPNLQRFLEFWKTSIEGPLFGVTVAHAKLIKPAELKHINGEFRLH